MWKGLIGIDIGGTHVGIGLINNETLSVENSVHIPINGVEISTTELVQLIIQEVQSMLKSQNHDLFNIKTVGIGCPGQVVNNVLVAASNFPKIVNAPIAGLVSRGLNGIFTYLMNDADAAASAEIWGNASCYAKYKNLAMITLGTGIGFSLILNGSLYQGSHGIIEGGHMIVDSSRNARKCPCGQSGCCEAYASARTTVQRLQELDASETTSKSSKAAKSSSSSSNIGHVVDGKVVFDRYHLNDFNAVRCVEETAENLAVLCINICRVIDPEVIIFGGGLSKAGSPLLDLIKKYVSQRTWTVLPTDVKLMLAVAEDNGILGAALAARNAASSGESSLLSKHDEKASKALSQEKEMALAFVASSIALLAIRTIQYKTRRKDDVREGSVLKWLSASLLVGQFAYGIYRIVQ